MEYQLQVPQQPKTTNTPNNVTATATSSSSDSSSFSCFLQHKLLQDMETQLEQQQEQLCDQREQFRVFQKQMGEQYQQQQF